MDRAGGRLDFPVDSSLFRCLLSSADHHGKKPETREEGEETRNAMCLFHLRGSGFLFPADDDEGQKMEMIIQSKGKPVLLSHSHLDLCT
ncbi:unnamed protein product [Menidia menidia]|uniref:(Atlantic silverside) hypothetical protein n=1 Tax=Menidia menidia TaxID=238744 RepID=A0A8S4C1E0_9TELE|nr:unnamed protein product [Menidia menidia]